MDLLSTFPQARGKCLFAGLSSVGVGWATGGINDAFDIYESELPDILFKKISGAASVKTVYIYLFK